MRASHPVLSETHLIGARTRERLLGPERCPALAPLGIGLCGISDATAPYRMARPRPAFGEVLATLAGHGRVWINGEWQALPPGQAYVCPRGAPHAFHPAPGRRWRFVWVHYAERPGDSRLLPGDTAHLATADPRPFAAAVLALLDENTAAADPEITAHLSAWVDLAARRLLRGDRPPDPRLRDLWSRVEADLAHPWDITTLARFAGVGPEQLRRLTHAALGLSPMAEVTRRRLERGAALLRGSPLRIEVIAETVGYGSIFAFSAAFKRLHGRPPSTFRRAVSS